MSGPDDIDALVVARRIVASPKTFGISTFESIALAECLIALDGWIERIEAGPTTNARLAAAVAVVVDLHDKHGATMDAVGDAAAVIDAAGGEDAIDETLITASQDANWAVHEALNTLKTVFEQEFPNV